MLIVGWTTEKLLSSEGINYVLFQRPDTRTAARLMLYMNRASHLPVTPSWFVAAAEPTSKKAVQKVCIVPCTREFSRYQTISVCSRHTITSELRFCLDELSRSRDVFFHRGQLETSVGEEKEFNPRLTQTLEEFVEIMENLNLPYPKQIGELKNKTITRLLQISTTIFAWNLILSNLSQHAGLQQTKHSSHAMKHKHQFSIFFCLFFYGVKEYFWRCY